MNEQTERMNVSPTTPQSLSQSISYEVDVHSMYYSPLELRRNPKITDQNYERYHGTTKARKSQSGSVSREDTNAENIVSPASRFIRVRDAQNIHATAFIDSYLYDRANSLAPDSLLIVRRHLRPCSNHAYRRVAASRSRIRDLSPREESIPRCFSSLLDNLARFPNRGFYVCATLHLLPYNVRAILAVPACTSFLDNVT